MRPFSSPSEDRPPARLRGVPAGEQFGPVPAGDRPGEPGGAEADGAGTPVRGALFGGLFGAAGVDAELTDRAVLQAMLDVERALVEAAADEGLVPAPMAGAIGRECRADRFDPAALGRDADAAGNPVVPLVRALTAAVPRDARPWVHLGATSQDVLDTAQVLVAVRAGVPLRQDLDAAADAAARLAHEHRDTVMVARTLGQQAAPTTFGLKAAGWLTALLDAGTRLDVLLDAGTRPDLPLDAGTRLDPLLDAGTRLDPQARPGQPPDRLGLPAQLGGAAGTLAALGPAGPAVADRLAHRLGLATSPLPWHTRRQPLLDLSAALGGLIVATGKIALDVGLLAQSEVAEVAEGGAAGRGGSSAMPHKQNPVDSILVTAAARRAPHLVATMYAAAIQEHERAAGGWHAEWEPLLDLLRLAGSVAFRTRRLLDGLRVRPDRMRANLAATGGLVLAEAVAARLASGVGRTAAHDLVARAAAESSRSGSTLRDALLADPTVRALLTDDDLDRALDPDRWLGSAGIFVDRALTRHREQRPAGDPPGEVGR
ncbi:class-II fumarase/aspartase family protein [Micromonospora sp. NBC_01796]|uniref:class-II fumarase/aspartase family protein n=1 Tax=Micromonospora sp. NBC_01796 TaxID=2975987 RepID=UPI002DDBC5EB|nr:adenylosuccinate lyase family protein [Micromonospora sp. NBC_01796]WSA85401.1 adenylosuccinate lyase family protein [Micromonospora sp. NBC_01796]